MAWAGAREWGRQRQIGAQDTWPLGPFRRPPISVSLRSLVQVATFYTCSIKFTLLGSLLSLILGLPRDVCTRALNAKGKALPVRARAHTR